MWPSALPSRLDHWFEQLPWGTTSGTRNTPGPPEPVGFISGELGEEHPECENNAHKRGPARALSGSLLQPRRPRSIKQAAGCRQATRCWVQLDAGPHGPWPSLPGPGATCWAQSNSWRSVRQPASTRTHWEEWASGVACSLGPSELHLLPGLSQPKPSRWQRENSADRPGRAGPGHRALSCLPPSLPPSLPEISGSRSTGARTRPAVLVRQVFGGQVLSQRLAPGTPAGPPAPGS